MTSTVDTAVASPCEEVADQTRLQRAAIGAVSWYQRTFSGGAPTCRFFPSCSEYAREALVVHGTGRGSWLAMRRLLRCRPFGPSGVDPVPEARTARPKKG